LSGSGPIETNHPRPTSLVAVSPFTELCEQAIELAAPTLDHRCELRALVDRHADSFDHHIDDLVVAGLTANAPLDACSGPVPRYDFAGDHRAALAVSAHLTNIARVDLIARQPHGISGNDVFREKRLERPDLVAGRAPPVATQDESADGAKIETNEEQAAKLGDPDDIIGAGEEGELIVDARADAVFTEYLHLPDATAEKVRDGWYYTGNVITVEDERGYFTLHGRVDDMIRSGGESIYPDEVEAVLQAQENVADCAVVGIADPKWGRMVLGCVVRQGDDEERMETPGLPAELDAHFRESSLASFKRPRGYVFVEEIPRNPGNGNVLRRLLRDSAVSARESQTGFHVID